MINYNAIKFLKSVNHPSQLPTDNGSEVAFAGRSNAGKSSALNAIAGIKRLAHTSKTPGRTQLINFFQFDANHALVDLPGYGFAKVPTQLKAHWGELLSDYIAHRQSLKGIILLMDIRHPLTPIDWQMIEWSLSLQRPMHILLTKADKLNYGAAKNALLSVKSTLAPYEALISIQTFSALKKDGILQAQQKIKAWLLNA
jgi:GTP-binding protein